MGDVIRLRRAQAELSEETYASRRARITMRLKELLAASWKDRHVKQRHQNDLLTLLDQPGVPFDNNAA